MMQWAVDGSQPTGENAAWTRTQLANLYFNQGNLQQAELEYRRTLAGRPNYAYALAGLGHVRAAQGRLDEAIQLLTQASQIVPLPDFVIALGDLYRAHWQFRRGRATVRVGAGHSAALPGQRRRP